jgi:HAD superfamily hydrolase (TIGR01509 family)
MAAEAVLFDLDGTVWDSHPWIAAIAGAGDAADTAALLAALRARRPAATLLRQAGISRGAFAEASRGKRRAALYAEAESTLVALRAQDIATAAVTNLPGWMANPMLDGLGLRALLQSVVTFERTRRRKPHPDPLLLALEELSVEASEAVWYVGDSASDGQAARAASVSFAWASWGYESAPPPLADKVLDHFAEALSL